MQITGGTFSTGNTSASDDHLTISGSASARAALSPGLYDSASEKLTLTGYDTLADYASLLSQVQYNATGTDPTDGGAHASRTVTWTVSDGAPGNPAGTNSTTDVVPDLTNSPPC